MKSDNKKIISYKQGSAAEHKFVTYVEALIQKPDFNKDIKKLRERYGVPPDGYKDYFTDPNDLNNDFPLIILPPKIDNKDFLNDSIKLTKKYGLPTDWFSIIQNLVAYSEFDWSDYDTSAISIFDGPKFPSDIREEFENKPVLILINPYNSERDIIDFIKKNYRTKIKPIQDRYVNTSLGIGKTRKKNPKIKEIHEFVRENSKVKIKELMGVVNKKFNKNYDYTHIQKIKKTQKEKQNPQ